VPRCCRRLPAVLCGDGDGRCTETQLPSFRAGGDDRPSPAFRRARVRPATRRPPVSLISGATIFTPMGVGRWALRLLVVPTVMLAPSAAAAQQPPPALPRAEQVSIGGLGGLGIPAQVAG